MQSLQPLPAWMQVRYARMWSVIKDKPFTLKKYLGTTGDDIKVALVFLSKLKQRGWLKVIPSQEDKRKKFYILFDPIQALMILGEKKHAD